jgi:hypothetical protein
VTEPLTVPAERAERPRLHTWWSARRPGQVGTVAAGLVLLQIAWRGWAAGRSYLWQDDFVITHSAWRRGLTPGMLLQDYHGHLEPARFLLVWVWLQLTPMNWPVVVIVSLAAQAVISWQLYLLLRDLFGPRPRILLPLAVYCFSPATLLSFIWWAAAWESLPLQAALVLALRAHLRHLRSRRTADGLLGVAATALGLAFYEKSLLVPVFLLGFTVVVWHDGSLVNRLRRTVEPSRWVWVAYVALVAAYLALYVTHVSSPSARGLDVGRILDFTRNAVASTFVPTLVGGPWRSDFAGATLLPVPSQTVQLITWQLAAAVIIASVVARRGRAVQAWALLAGYLALDLALVVLSGRLDFIGALIGRDPRYTADAAVVAALAVGLAFFPVLGQETRSSAGRPLRPLTPRLEWVVVAALLVVYLNSCWVTTRQTADVLRHTDSRTFVANARSAIGSDRGLDLYDGPVPASVLSPLFGTDARASRIVDQLPGVARFPLSSVDLRELDGFGFPRSVEIKATAAAGAGPAAGCGWPLTSAVSIPLNDAVGSAPIPFPWVVSIGFYTKQEVPAVVSVGGDRVPVRFVPGLHHLSVLTDAAMDRVLVSGLKDGQAVCITDVTVGVPWPAPE